MAESRRGWFLGAIGAAIVAMVAVMAFTSSGNDESADGSEEPQNESGAADATVGTDIASLGEGGGDPSVASEGAAGRSIETTTDRALARGGDAGIGYGDVPGSVAVELGRDRAAATSGARLGQALYLLDRQRERLPLIEQRIADAERAGDAERLRIERERLAIARSRIAELEAQATELEAAARADGTLGDADREGPRPIGVGKRPEQPASAP